MAENLDLKFTEAFNKLSELEEVLAPDIMLKLYAFYKQAVIGVTLCLSGLLKYFLQVLYIVFLHLLGSYHLTESKH